MNIHFKQIETKFYETQFQTHLSKGFLSQKLNPLLPLYRDNTLFFQDGLFHGLHWVQNKFYELPIEQISVQDNLVLLLQRNSCNLIQLQGNLEQQIPIRRNNQHRVSIIKDSIINYNEKTLNGNKIAQSVNINSHYIPEIDDFIEDDRLQRKQTKLIVPPQYNKVNCIKIDYESYILSFFIENQENVNIMIQGDQQIPFYRQVYHVNGQISQIQGFIVILSQQKLYLITNDGLQLEEEIKGRSFLHQDKIYELIDDNLIETQNKNIVTFRRVIKYRIYELQLMKKSDKSKLRLQNSLLDKNQIINYLINIDDYKFIKDYINSKFKDRVFNLQDIFQLYEHLSHKFKKTKLKGRIRLLKCYNPNDLQISFLQCIQSDSLDIEEFIKIFQHHLIYNYIHTLNYICHFRQEFISQFLPNGKLFHQFQPNAEGFILTTNRLTDLNYLSLDDIPLVKANYNKIAQDTLINLYGMTRQVQILKTEQQLDYFLYNFLVNNTLKSRINLNEFQQQENKQLYVIELLEDYEVFIDKVGIFYQNNNLNFLEVLLKLLLESKQFIKLYIQLQKYQQYIAQFGLSQFDIINNRLLTISTDEYQSLEQIKDIFEELLLNFNQQEQHKIREYISQLDSFISISQLLNNFYISLQLYQLKEMITQLKQTKLIEQLSDHYFVKRIRDINYQEYNLYSTQDFRKLLITVFAIKDPILVDQILFIKLIDYGKQKDLIQLVPILQLSPQQIDEIIRDCLIKYLKQQKNVDKIEEQRKVFKSICQEITKLTKYQLKLSKKEMNFYKFINISKETGDFRFKTQESCNFYLQQLYKRTQNLNLPYIRMKKKLAKANDLIVYDIEFCQFMIKIAQDTQKSDKQRAQLIFNELLKAGHPSISSEISIIMVDTHQDEKVRNDHYWKVLKQTTSAESIHNLINIYQNKTQFDHSPKKTELPSNELLQQPLNNKSDINKFKYSYLQLYNDKQIETIFLDTLLIDHNEAFNILRRKKNYQGYELIKQICQTSYFKIDVLLQQYLKTLTEEQNYQVLLQQEGLIENVTQSLIISRHLNFFDKESVFDKTHRNQQIIEKLNTIDLEQVMPEIIYFRDFNLEEIKLNLFNQTLYSINLQDFYIKKVENQVQKARGQFKGLKIKPQITDCLFHFILFENELKLDQKEKTLLRSFLNQCVFSENRNQWNIVYFETLQNRKFDNLCEPLRIILLPTNYFIILYLIKKFYQDECADEVTDLYLQKLLSVPNDQFSIELAQQLLNGVSKAQKEKLQQIIRNKIDKEGCEALKILL